MSEPALTIGETPSAGVNGPPRAPRLELSGCWLEDAGFPIGIRVRVEVVEPGRLEVRRVPRASSAQGRLPLVWIPAEQIGRGEETRWTVQKAAADG
jgi:Toxin SymE, type I toxin-antitoxin system